MEERSRQRSTPGFRSAATTAREVIGNSRLDGKVAVVTGGYVGIGLETTRVLAEAGATVSVVPARRSGEGARRARGNPRRGARERRARRAGHGRTPSSRASSRPGVRSTSCSTTPGSWRSRSRRTARGFELPGSRPRTTSGTSSSPRGCGLPSSGRTERASSRSRRAATPLRRWTWRTRASSAGRTTSGRRTGNRRAPTPSSRSRSTRAARGTVCAHSRCTLASSRPSSRAAFRRRSSAP